MYCSAWPRSNAPSTSDRIGEGSRWMDSALCVTNKQHWCGAQIGKHRPSTKIGGMILAVTKHAMNSSMFVSWPPKPQARMPVQPHPLTHLPIHKQKHVTIWYGHTPPRTSEIRVLSSFIDVENTFSFSHPLPCLLSPLWAHWSFQESWGFSLRLSLQFLDAWRCFLSVPLAIRYSSISFQAWSSCATQN